MNKAGARAGVHVHPRIPSKNLHLLPGNFVHLTVHPRSYLLSRNTEIQQRRHQLLCHHHRKNWMVPRFAPPRKKILRALMVRGALSHTATRPSVRPFVHLFHVHSSTTTHFRPLSLSIRPSMHLYLSSDKQFKCK